jgi:hypothetical protein
MMPGLSKYGERLSGDLSGKDIYRRFHFPVQGAVLARVIYKNC